MSSAARIRSVLCASNEIFEKKVELAMSTGNVSRRGFFAGLGLVGTAGVLAACNTDTSTNSTDATTAGGEQPPILSARSTDRTTIPFDGAHQAGIQTPSQANAVVVAFDLNREGLSPRELRRNLRRLMVIWTGDARSMTQGETALADLESELTAAPLNLTVTVGWSPKLIADAKLDSKTPSWVKNHQQGLPPFKGDRLNEDFSHGDVVLQVCGDDLTAVSHAVRVLTRGGQDYCRPRWIQRGFVDSPQGQTPRNLLGFKDGTANPANDAEYDETIWDDQGGTSMVVRRIVYDMPDWEALDRPSREVVFGRTIKEGAPLGGVAETDPVDLNKVDQTGLPYIDPRSHVGIAAGNGKRMRRRAYNWDGEISPLGSTGLIFISFQDDPEQGFSELQRRLADKDRLNRWITHVGSALFWCPPGTQSGAYWGQKVLEG